MAPPAVALAEPTATCSNGTAATIKVVQGDTLVIIAKEKLGITLPSLLAANPQIKNPDAIEVGQEINVPLCSAGTSGVTAVEGGNGNGTATGEAPKASESEKPKKENVVEKRRMKLAKRAEIMETAA